MNIDDLLLFNLVVEQGSFAKTAEVKGLANSVVSKRISRLEKNLCVQLFYRTTRKLTLTEAGQRLATEAKNISESVESAVNSMLDYGEQISGHIKMSVPTISGDLLLADAVAEFCNEYPGLSINMSLDNQFVDLISGRFDLVIRTGHLEDSSLIARHIIDSHWIICASPKYIASNPEIKHPSQFKEHNCLLYTYQSSGANDWLFKDKAQSYSVKVSGNFSTDNASALRKAALKGHGVAYVPKCLVYEDLTKSRLVELLPNQAGKILGVYAVYPYTRNVPQKLTLLIEKIRLQYLAYADYF